MGGYIGATAVGLTTTAADVQGDITSTDTTPELILKNTSEEDTEGGREGKITFKGEQSGGEESTLAQIESAHDGTSDDQKGDLIFKTNDGSDGASPTERMRIDSAGQITLTGNIANTSGDFTLDVDGDIVLDANGAQLRFKDDGTEIGVISNSSNDLQIVSSVSDADMIFRGNDGGTPFNALTLDMSAAGAATFTGTLKTSQSSVITANADADDLVIEKTGDTGLSILSTTTGRIYFGDAANDDAGSIRYVHSDNSMRFETDDAEAMRIDSSQNVGIGLTSPATKLDVDGGANSAHATFSGTAGRGLKISTASGGAADEVVDFDAQASGSTQALTFSTGGTERMRIDGSGHAYVGKTSTSVAVAGSVFQSSGVSNHAADQAAALAIGRLNNSGDMLLFYSDTTKVGSIATVSGDIAIFSTATSHSGLRFGNKQILPTNHSGTISDNDTDLGDVSFRFDDIYATNGTIQTSDENEKQNIASLTSAEITAATAISKLFKTFKWKDKVAAKGDNARTHTGVIAQQVQSAMSDAGLDASKYAFWCSKTWWEKDVEVAAVEANESEGIEAADAYTRTDVYDTKDEAPKGATERTRMGVRYPELLAFIGAATEQRLTSIEARLDALEG